MRVLRQNRSITLAIDGALAAEWHWQIGHSRPASAIRMQALGVTPRARLMSDADAVGHRLRLNITVFSRTQWMAWVYEGASATIVSPRKMLQLTAAQLVFAVAHLERIEVLCVEWEKQVDGPRGQVDRSMSRKVRLNIAATYKSISESAAVINLPVTKAAAERAETRLRKRSEQISYRQLKNINGDVRGRFEDEIGQTSLYCLNKGHSEFYSSVGPLFGDLVEQRIPDASDDISEGGKCFAVGRYTASTFHLMRAMEIAVQALSSNLGIEKVDREWGKLLSDIAGKIALMAKGDKKDAWSAVHANLYHVKQAWRNATMHPKRTYTEEEAREVFHSVKAFMRELCQLLPEGE